MKIKKIMLVLAIVTIMIVAVPVLMASAADETFVGNGSAQVNTTYLTDGYVKVAYLSGGTQRVKVIITGPDKVKYTYDLNLKGNYEAFPFSAGDGSYSIGIYKNISGTSYSTVYTTTVTVKLKDQFAPYLNSNQYVNYTADSEAVKKAVELTEESEDEFDKIKAIYKFVINNLTYDKTKAKTVQSGYLPDIDKVLAAKRGICFDYAALMTAMARSQGVPCKLVVGYAGDAYHAWISIYTQESGWIDNVISFNGKEWKLMDPTFASSGKGSESIMKYIGDGKNYSAKYFY